MVYQFLQVFKNAANEGNITTLDPHKSSSAPTDACADHNRSQAFPYARQGGGRRAGDCRTVHGRRMSLPPARL